MRYTRRGANYYCDRNRERNCRTHVYFASGALDDCIGRELCVALEPLGIEAAIAARELKEKEHAEQIQSAQMQFEAAQYAADRAFEQFDRCDPKNRLVADTLEERWNHRLADLQKAQEGLKEVSKKPVALTGRQIKRLEELGENFSEVWRRSTVDPKLKKRLLRAAICEIVVKDDSQRLEATIHWQGGAHTRVYVPVVRCCTRGSGNSHDSLLELIEKLMSHHSDREIARVLNLKKLMTPSGLRWTQDRVSAFRNKHHLTKCGRSDEQEYLSLKCASALLGISPTALRELVKRGAISASQVTEFAVWRIPRRDLDSESVQRLASALKRTGRLPDQTPPGQTTLFEEDV